MLKEQKNKLKNKLIIKNSSYNMVIKWNKEFRNIQKMLFFLKSKNKINYNNGLKEIRNYIIKIKQIFINN